MSLFEEAVDRTSFLKRYAEVAARHRWVPLAYCLMGNHLHLVIETPERTLGVGARDLLSYFAKRHNERRDEVGHVFQGRFDSGIVTNDTYFAQLLRYVALNPVAAGICDAPHDWPWSSHRALIAGHGGRLASSGRVEELLAVWGGPPGGRYAALFAEDHPLAGRYGSQDPSTWRPSLESFFEDNARDRAIVGAREHGYRLAEIARHLDVHESTVSRWAHRVGGRPCKKGA